MQRTVLAAIALAMLVAVTAWAQQPSTPGAPPPATPAPPPPPAVQPPPAPGAPPAAAQRPPFATTKVDGTDNVYIFRYGNHQAMFVTTPDGVIATDPIGYGRPQAVTTYVAEIRKVTDKPIKYLV